MKKALIVLTVLLTSVCCKAQEELSFPFQGGNEIFTRFFKDNLVVSPEMMQQRANGTVTVKFTADTKGVVTKIVVYYSDDYSLTMPVIEALKKSDHQWIIPDHEKFHDYIISFSINFNPPAAGRGADTALYNFYARRRPMLTYNQVPLNDATLLPTVAVNYDLP